MPFAAFRFSRALVTAGTAVAGLCLMAGTALAQVPSAAPDMTPPKLDLDAFLKQSEALHDNNPQVPGSLAAKGEIKLTAQADTARAEAARVNLPKASIDAIERVLSLTTGEEADTDAVTRSIAFGQGRLPVMPTMESLDHATAQAVVEAFHTPGGLTAYDRAQIAATASANPEVEERVALVRTIYRVDGTDAILRHFIGTQHMKAIITEVNNHIDISRLSEAEKYRMAAIAATAQTELEEKVLNMDARVQAANLSKAELLQLIGAFDSDAQRKLTQMRIKDDGKLDRAVTLEIQLAQIQIVKAFEKSQ